MQKVIRVFIASPSDVHQERDIVDHAIGRLSTVLDHQFGVMLKTVRWEEFAPIASGNPGEGFQGLINPRLDECGLFVGILYNRYGTPIAANRPESGTEVEFQFALKNQTRLSILTYFRNPSADAILSPAEADQRDKLQQLKDKIAEAKLPYQTYSSLDVFRNRIFPDLLE